MFDLMILSVALQLQAVPDEFYKSETSKEVRAVIEQLDALPVEDAVSQLEALAQNGDDSALELLGEMFNEGLGGFPNDANRACDYFERQEGRRADGLHNYATCFYSGRGRDEDLARARSLYKKAAEAGWRMSFCAYGNMLVRGQGGPEDQAEGVRLCRMTSVAGDPDAQTDYGGYLLMGVGVDRDPVAARFVLEQAGVQEQPNAAFLLAQIYQKGDGVEADTHLSREWFERAYQWGRLDAAFQLGLNYARRGFRQEGEEMFVESELMGRAVKWFEVAAERDPDAKTREQAKEMVENSNRLIAASRK
ncbi:tetratricopeptide repeat protein [Erythrobacter crassostreae]|uniref:Sel1 repeat family protein n=1 Tax=Erythrobacter crassostreae TaxID=2828328 RepID=A0A9X1F1E4_9SPHN|nr:tetratricopeptide repeat protein [Erythrobacter crassostrea]MBV7258555.1 sel1 repeat family protein [Erythrobacter crassostrea]